MLSLCRESYGNYVSSDAYLQLRRAYALIDVLRYADLSVVPLDLVYLYLSYTDTPDNRLRHWIFRCLNTDDDADIRHAIQSGIVPKGLATMASRYLSQCCEAHVDSILKLMCHGALGHMPGRRDWEVRRCYPVAVGRALDRLVMPQSVKLRDVKHTIDALHAAICPTITKEISEEYRSKKVPLTRTQIERFAWLHRIAYNIDISCFDAYTRNTLCNLLEILLVLDAQCAPYLESLCHKEVQDYNRVFANERGVLMAYPDTSAPITGLFLGLDKVSYFGADDTMDKALSVLSKLSPQAALCLGTGVDIRRTVSGNFEQYDFLRQLDVSLLTKLLDMLNNASRETCLYVKHELFMERMQIERMLKDGIICPDADKVQEG